MDLIRLGITLSSRKFGSKACTLFLLKQILTENIQFEHENEMHIYDTSLLNCTPPRLFETAIVIFFPWFRSSTWRPSSEAKSQRITPHLCLVIPDTVWFRINKTAWTGSWLFVATFWRFDPSVNTSKKFVLGDQFILFRCIKLFHPVLCFLITRKLALVTVNAHPQNQAFQLCESEALIFAPILVWCVEMVKEPGQQSYKEATYWLSPCYEIQCTNSLKLNSVTQCSLGK